MEAVDLLKERAEEDDPNSLFALVNDLSKVFYFSNMYIDWVSEKMFSIAVRSYSNDFIDHVYIYIFFQCELRLWKQHKDVTTTLST